MSGGELIERIRAGEVEIVKLVEQLGRDERQRRRATSVALSGIADDSPERLVEFGDDLVPFLSSGDLTVRMQVSSAVAALAREDPQLAVDAASELKQRLADESTVVRKNALVALRVAAETDVQAVEPAAERIVALLDSELAAVRQRAVAILLLIGRESPTSLSPHVGALVSRLDERNDSVADINGEYAPSQSSGLETQERDPLRRIQQDEQIRINAIRQGVAVLLGTISEADPAVFEGHVDTIRRYLNDEDKVVRKSAIEIIGFTAMAGIIPSRSPVEGLCDRLDDDPFEIVRGRSAWTLAILAGRIESVRSTAATPLAGNLELLESDDVEVRIGAAALMAAVVDSSPEVADEARSEVVVLLEDESPVVRQHGVYILNALDNDRSSRLLERVRDEDPNEDVAEFAAEVLAADH